jgi:DTW domain-containing protein YfiP
MAPRVREHHASTATAVPVSEPVEERCERCGKPRYACVCDRIVPMKTKTRIVILQHPQEDDAVLGTARILTTALPSAKIVVGLSWPSFEAVLGNQAVDRSKWATVFAHKIPASVSPNAAAIVMDRHGTSTPGARLDGIVLLDGTWSQAKTLWWRNPWLLKLGRISLRPREPSMYGKMRKEPRREAVSTLEAAADTLDALGEDPMIRGELRKLMRTMVQRVRDHETASAPPPKPKPKPKR